MFLLAAAAAAATAAEPLPRAVAVPVAAEATATVRIVAGALISATELPDEALVRDTRVTGPDGVERKVRLVEFP